MTDFSIFHNEMLKNFSLENFGNRIIILGPMASGKSTTAKLLGEKLNIPVHHLDRLYFLPNSDWQKVPFEDFKRKHDFIVSSERWIMDGNYKETFANRVARATTVILFNPPWIRSVFNFYRRYFRPARQSNGYPGKVAQVHEKFTVTDLKYIFRFKRNVKFFLKELEIFPVEKFLYFSSFSEIKRFQDLLRHSPFP